MAESSSKVPVRTEKSSPQLPQQWEPFERFRREMDRLFDDFSSGFWRGSLFGMAPFRRAEAAFRTMPAVDVAETDKAYEITAELPGLEEKNIEVKLANGVLSIKGEKQVRKKRKRRTTIGASAALARSSAAFRYPMMLRRTKSRPTSKIGYCR
jgi:HSP20 family protein